MALLPKLGAVSGAIAHAGLKPRPAASEPATTRALQTPSPLAHASSFTQQRAAVPPPPWLVPNASMRVLAVGATPETLSPFFTSRAQIVHLHRPSEAPNALAHYTQPLETARALSEQGVTAKAFDVVLADASAAQSHADELFGALSPGGQLGISGGASSSRAWVAAAQAHGFALEPNLPEGQLGFRAPGTARVMPGEVMRSASVDRDAISRVVSQKMTTGAIEPEANPGTFDAALAHAEFQRLHDTFVSQVAAGAVAVDTLPFPSRNYSVLGGGSRPAGKSSHGGSLFMVPHPDDETLAFGGAVGALKLQGERVTLALITSGEGGRGSANKQFLQRQRSIEFHNASQALSVDGVTHLGFADSGKYRDGHRQVPKTSADVLNDWGVNGTLETLVRTIRTERPRTVLSFDATRDANYSQHGAHLASGVATQVAVQLAKDPAFFPQHAAEGLGPWAVDRHLTRVPASTNASLHPLGEAGFAEVKPNVNTQRAAMSAYTSQVFSLTHDAGELERWGLAQGEPLPANGLFNHQPATGSAVAEAKAVQAISLPIRPAGIAKLYFEKPSEARHLYEAVPLVTKGRQVQARSYPRAELTALLKNQNTRFGNDSPAVNANIEALNSPSTVAVVTGQQVGLGGGPLYSLYKALGAVEQAHALSREGVEAVPVFWLAAYDHDLAEVSKLQVYGTEATPKTLKTSSDRSGSAVGNLPIGTAGADALRGLVDAAATKLSPALSAALRTAIAPELTYTQSFARLFSTLLRDTGLVLIDPSEVGFAKLNTKLIEHELFGNDSSAAAAARSSQAITDLGYTPQVTLTPEKLNVFFTDDAGARVSLSKVADGSFATGGSPSTMSAQTVRALVASHPERFTPNALLRPVFEDNVIPTVSYVGGPSEVQYYGQTKGLYEWAGVPMPVVSQRASFALAKPKALSMAIEQLGLTGFEVARAPEAQTQLAMQAVPKAVKQAYSRAEAFSAANATWYGQLQAAGASKAPAELAREVKARHAEGRALIESIQTVATAEAAQMPELARGLKGLENAATQWEKQFALQEKMLAEHALKPIELQKAQTLSLRPLAAAFEALTATVNQLPKIARAASRDTLTELMTLENNGVPQERVMSVLEGVTRYGQGLVDELLPHAQPWTPMGLKASNE